MKYTKEHYKIVKTLENVEQFFENKTLVITGTASLCLQNPNFPYTPNDIDIVVYVDNSYLKWVKQNYKFLNMEKASEYHNEDNKFVVYKKFNNQKVNLIFELKEAFNPKECVSIKVANSDYMDLAILHNEAHVVTKKMEYGRQKDYDFLSKFFNWKNLTYKK